MTIRRPLSSVARVDIAGVGTLRHGKAGGLRKQEQGQEKDVAASHREGLQPQLTAKPEAAVYADPSPERA